MNVLCDMILQRKKGNSQHLLFKNECSVYNVPNFSAKSTKEVFTHRTMVLLKTCYLLWSTVMQEGNPYQPH